MPSADKSGEGSRKLAEDARQKTPTTSTPVRTRPSGAHLSNELMEEPQTACTEGATRGSSGAIAWMGLDTA